MRMRSSWRVQVLARYEALGVLAHLLDCGNDVGVCPATADVAAHEFLHCCIVRPARFFEQSDRGHDLARGAVSALISIVGEKGCLHRMQRVRRTKALDGCDLLAVMDQGQ